MGKGLGLDEGSEEKKIQRSFLSCAKTSWDDLAIARLAQAFIERDTHVQSLKSGLSPHFCG